MDCVLVLPNNWTFLNYITDPPPHYLKDNFFKDEARIMETVTAGKQLETYKLKGVFSLAVWQNFQLFGIAQEGNIYIFFF